MPKLGLGLSLPARISSASAPSSYDPDALVYINAVQAADGQALETGVKVAINTFVVGCKSDNIWSAIKASCILAGARTLNGALVPLAGTAPTNNLFVSGDYSRTLGLLGNGSTKNLLSNRNNTADPQNSKHISVYCTSGSSRDTTRFLIGSGAGVGGTLLSTDNNSFRVRVNYLTAPATIPTGTTPITGFFGANRASNTQFDYRFSSTSAIVLNASTTPRSDNIAIFSNPASGSHSNARISFYSIGESISLTNLESRIVSLMSGISAAL